MKETKTSVFTNGLIWFGAAISIAEIITGTCLASLGLSRGILAIVVGHIIGGIIMYLVGMIGANTQQSSMETVKQSFGYRGAVWFASLNVLQLVGWTAVMITSGAAAASSIFTGVSPTLFACLIGGLIIVWIFIGLRNLSKINIVAMSGLMIIAIILSTIIFKESGGTQGALVLAGKLSFGSAVELAIAMPLSWLPMVSDYTRKAKRKKAATLSSVISYGVVSSWMFTIGLGAAIYTGESDVAQIMVKAGLGVAGLLIVILSTVTTTFLDVYSAGVSAVSIWSKCKERVVAIAVAIIGTILAIMTPMGQMESFLYLIGSVFAPMIAIQLTNYYILKKDYSQQAIHLLDILLWCIGFVAYRQFMYIDTPIGSTVPVMIIIATADIVISKIYEKARRRRNDE